MYIHIYTYTSTYIYIYITLGRDPDFGAAWRPPPPEEWTKVVKEIHDASLAGCESSFLRQLSFGRLF